MMKYQELPKGELEELSDLRNVRWKAFRFWLWGGGTAFRIHGDGDDGDDSDGHSDDDGGDDLYDDGGELANWRFIPQAQEDQPRWWKHWT